MGDSSLPHPWEECYSEEGELYYWNTETDETSWERPKPVIKSPPIVITPNGRANTLQRNNTTLIPSSSLKTPWGSAPPSSLSSPALMANVNSSPTFTAQTTPTSKVLKRGNLFKLSGIKWKMYWFALNEDNLVYYKDQGENSLKGEIPVKNGLVEEDKVVKRAHTIHINNRKKDYCISADTKGSFDEWLHALKCVASGKPQEASALPTSSTTPTLSTSPKPIVANSPPKAALSVPRVALAPPTALAPTPASQIDKPRLSRSFSASVMKSNSAPPSTPPRNLALSGGLSSPTLMAPAKKPLPQLPTLPIPPVPSGVSPPSLPPRSPATTSASFNPPIKMAPMVPSNRPPAAVPPMAPMAAKPTIPIAAPSARPIVKPVVKPAAGNDKKEGKNFKPNLQLKTLGSHASIGLPITVVHTANFAANNFTWAYEGGLQKMGWLEKQDWNGNWERFFMIVDGGFIKWYKSETDVGETGFLDLKNTTIDPFLGSNKSFSFQVITLTQDKHYFAATSRDDTEEWSCAIKINGATDGEFSRRDKEMREKQLADQRKNANRQALKEEEEYIRNKKNISEDRKQLQERIAAIDPATCQAAFTLESLREGDDDLAFKIHVLYGPQEWFIHRTEKEFSTMFQVLVSPYIAVSVPSLKGYLPKKPKENVQSFVPAYQELLTKIEAERALIFSDKKLTAAFVRFFAPVKYGDQKPPEFVMPFKLEVL